MADEWTPRWRKFIKRWTLKSLWRCQKWLFLTLKTSKQVSEGLSPPPASPGHLFSPIPFRVWALKKPPWWNPPLRRRHWSPSEGREHNLLQSITAVFFCNLQRENGFLFPDAEKKPWFVSHQIKNDNGGKRETWKRAEGGLGFSSFKGSDVTGRSDCFRITRLKSGPEMFDCPWSRRALRWDKQEVMREPEVETLSRFPAAESHQLLSIHTPIRREILIWRPVKLMFESSSALKSCHQVVVKSLKSLQSDVSELLQIQFLLLFGGGASDGINLSWGTPLENTWPGFDWLNTINHCFPVAA